MSTGFRIFILILCAFGAIAAYRLRTPELSHWLRSTARGTGGTPVRGTEAGGAPLVSPVDRILEPDLATLELKGREPRPEPVMEPAAAPLSEEDVQSVADLPVVEEDPPAPGEPPAPEEQAGPSPADDVPPPTPDRPNRAEPQAPEVAAFDEVAYEVKEGDNLWRIAAKFLGSGSRFPEIRELNREVFGDRGSDVVPAGTVLRIHVPASREGLKVPAPGVDTSVERSPGRAPPDGREDRYHTVRRSESLQRIARRYFPEEADGWKILFAANKDRLASPDRVLEGQVLRIPAPPR